MPWIILTDSMINHYHYHYYAVLGERQNEGSIYINHTRNRIDLACQNGINLNDTIKRIQEGFETEYGMGIEYV